MVGLDGLDRANGAGFDGFFRRRRRGFVLVAAMGFAFVVVVVGFFFRRFRGLGLGLVVGFFLGLVFLGLAKIAIGIIIQQFPYR